MQDHRALGGLPELGVRQATNSFDANAPLRKGLGVGGNCKSL